METQFQVREWSDVVASEDETKEYHVDVTPSARGTSMSCRS